MGERGPPNAAYAKRRELVERLERGFQRVQQSDEYRRYLDTVSRFHQYSINNTMLIWIQQPGATLVAGFRTWLSLGRHVRKGEVGIRIFAPTRRCQSNEALDNRSRPLYFTNRLNTMTSTATLDPISATFSALADPTRRAILHRLSAGEASVTELAAPFDISLPAISKHLKVLERAGLVARGREAQWRPCRLQAAPLREAASWLDEYRQFWEESFSRLDDLLDELKQQEEGEQNENHE